jgi:beta-xylosidase
MKLISVVLFFYISCLSVNTIAQNSNTFYNPILPYDYSDPDVTRVGNDYYMTASSFNHVPGLPILHSTNLVDWKLINYALTSLVPKAHFEKVQHGAGVWAPAIRYYNGEFYIFYPDPDFGIYYIKTKNPMKVWSEPYLIIEGKGLIDPCPFWDSNGIVYLVHAFAGSRAQVKSIIVMAELSADLKKQIGETKLIYDGNILDPTIEGPKLYKRNNYYYIFAPGGGVSTGWQTVLRSKNIYGPYERKVVLHQGKTNINGPHQGAWITTSSNEDWFFHFQDKDAFGRIVHLQPLVWKNDWPIIGNVVNPDSIGSPVENYLFPKYTKPSTIKTYNQSDSFTNNLGLHWQWQANPKINWAYIYNNKLRLYTQQKTDSANNIWMQPNLLLQKIKSNASTYLANVSLHLKQPNEQIGFTVFGLDYAYLSIRFNNGKYYLSYIECSNADKNGTEVELNKTEIEQLNLKLKVTIDNNAKCKFYYSLNNNDFINIGSQFTAKPGKWVGAKIGFFAIRPTKTNDAGFVEIDDFTVQ